MTRYFIKLQYNGTNYHGWQSQLSDDPTIQGDLQDAFSTILQETIEIVGCGRTDAGVHALDYYMHIDVEQELTVTLINRINKYLSKDIAVLSFHKVKPDAHARFDARSRSYQYHIHFDKNPFLNSSSFFYPYKDIDFDLLRESVTMLLEYTDFDTFCKSRTDVKTKKCKLTVSKWEVYEDRAVYNVSANRFLRGMIRLIVGMSLHVARGKISLEYVKSQMDKREILEKAFSVPANGLYLNDIKYPQL